MNTSTDHVRRRALVTLLASLLVAGVLAVVVVLPAEIGWDPLGSGQALGLTGLSGGEEHLEVVVYDGEMKSDRRQFVLDPFGSVEIKYDMATDASLLFQWSADGEVLFDLHAEPTIGGSDAAVSFDQGRSTRRAGSYIAEFDGIHGWFFENRGHSTVVVTLALEGFVTGVTLYEGNDQRRVPLLE